MIKKLLMLGAIFGMVFWVVVPNFAQQKKNIPNSEILGELDIMKGILKEMLSNNKNDFFSSNLIKGIYLPDYGIVFNVNAPKAQIEAMRAQFRLLESQQEAINESLEAAPVAIKEMEDALPSVLREFNEEAKIDSFRQLLKKKKQAFRQRLEKMRKGIRARRAAKLEKIKSAITKNKQSFQEFLENYADVGNLLKPDQRITIFYNWDSTLDSISMPIFFSVKKSDILSFRSGKITKSQFWAKVKKGSRPSEEIQKQLEIMKQVLETGLKTTSSYSWGTGEIDAQVLPGYGVWFDLGNPHFGPSIILPSFSSGKSTQGDKKAKRQEAIRSYYSRITKLIGQYGLGMRFLKPEQWVIVSFRTGSSSYGLKSTLYLLRVKKADIQKLRQKKIDFQEFQKRAELFAFRA